MESKTFQFACGICNIPGHDDKACSQLSSVKCTICGEKGLHKWTTCPKKCGICKSTTHIAEECKNFPCGFCHGKGHPKNKCEALMEVQCRKCEKYGHTTSRCSYCKVCDTNHTEECPNKKEVVVQCNYCKEEGHKISACPNMYCNYCEKDGHTAKNCPLSEYNPHYGRKQ